MAPLNQRQHEQHISHYIQAGSLRVHVKPAKRNCLIGSTKCDSIVKLSLQDFNGELEIELMGQTSPAAPKTKNHQRSSAIMISSHIEQTSASIVEHPETMGYCGAILTRSCFHEDTKKPGRPFKKQKVNNENLRVVGNKENKVNKTCDKKTASKQSRGKRKRSRSASPKKRSVTPQDNKEKQNDTQANSGRMKKQVSLPSINSTQGCPKKADGPKMKLKEDRRKSTRNVAQHCRKKASCRRWQQKHLGRAMNKAITNSVPTIVKRRKMHLRELLNR